MNKLHTDQKLLIKGLKRLALGLPSIVLTTYILTFGFLNKETIPLYIFLTLGIIAMAATIYLLFNGIKMILKSIF
jgi:ABC-type sulfate transport system permease subunit